MNTGLTQHRVQQVGRGIGHLAVLREVGRALHIHRDTQDAVHLVQAAQRALQQGQCTQGADTRGCAGLLQRHFRASPAGGHHLVAHPGNLAAHIQLQAMPHQGGVMAADLDVAVEGMACGGRGLEEKGVTVHGYPLGGG